MDIKITGVTFDILRDALTQAKAGLTHILGQMAEVISEHRSELSEYAPRISSISIDTDKIGLVIGKGGETIRSLQEEFESQIDVQDDGTILVYATSGLQGDALVDRIRSMTKEVEVGDEFQGKVVKTTTFGAFVELAKGTDGLLHISNVSPGQRVDTVEEILNKGRRHRRPRGRGGPRARPHRPAPRRGPRGRRQVQGGARDGRRRRRRRWRARRRPRPAAQRPRGWRRRPRRGTAATAARAARAATAIRIAGSCPAIA
jgi:hypothetical protein